MNFASAVLWKALWRSDVKTFQCTQVVMWLLYIDSFEKTINAERCKTVYKTKKTKLQFWNLHPLKLLDTDTAPSWWKQNGCDLFSIDIWVSFGIFNMVRSQFISKSQQSWRMLDDVVAGSFEFVIDWCIWYVSYQTSSIFLWNEILVDWFMTYLNWKYGNCFCFVLSGSKTKKMG